MKSFVLLLSLSISVISYASSIQIGTGGITPHFSAEKKNYCNQWNDTSIIVNKSYYIRYMGERFGISYMVGEDSICSPISGAFLHYLLNSYEVVDIGLTIGAYQYNRNNWKEHALNTPSDIDAPSTLLVEIDGKEHVPVLALDVGIHLIRRGDWSLKLNNLFTPIIFNHSLALEYRF